jgi:hypothetical protein
MAGLWMMTYYAVVERQEKAQQLSSRAEQCMSPLSTAPLCIKLTYKHQGQPSVF